MNLRKLAQGKECQMRYPGVCNGNPATTVLGHIRMAGITGTGLKAPDLLGAWLCSDCHDLTDGRVHLSGDQSERIRLSFFEAVVRTQYELIKMGAVK